MAEILLQVVNICSSLSDICTAGLCVLDSTNMFYYVASFIVGGHMLALAEKMIEKGLIL